LLISNGIEITLTEENVRHCIVEYVIKPTKEEASSIKLSDMKIVEV